MKGQVIHLTDLEAAISQADTFRQYKHAEDKYYELDKHWLHTGTSFMNNWFT